MDANGVCAAMGAQMVSGAFYYESWNARKAVGKGVSFKSVNVSYGIHTV